MNAKEPAKLNSLSDLELILLCRSGKDDAFALLAGRYQPLVHSQVATWHLCPQDAEDFTQEAWISFLNSVRKYDSSKGVPFSSFAAICMQNRLNSVARRHKAASRLKTVSLDSEELSADSLTASDPAQELADRQQAETIAARMADFLSARENQIFSLYLRGLTYEQMANQFQIPVKSVDNALTRIRGKLRKLSLS